MIKALFLDIDGTLVSFQTHEIPTSTIEAITAAREAGVKVFIATGRPKVIMNNIGALQERGLIDGYVTMNGGYNYVGSELIFGRAIPATDVSTLARLSTEQQFPCIFVGEDDICVCYPDELVKKVFIEFLKVDEMPVRTPEEVAGKEIFQITPFINETYQQSIMPLLHGCEAERWHPAFVDITAEGNTKQHGIDCIIRHFGFKLEETMAIGDGGNDRGMLKHAHIGVAMGNASDEVKACADYVTASVDDDGVAKALRHFQVI
jgi:Cof subfamily protein (haloacid dehalogenase superfamily)